MDANPDAPIAAWLRASRRSQEMDDGAGGTKPWTVKHFLALLEAEERWAPAHSNYSNYELGKQTPTAVTLKRFTDFWARRGIDGPDLSPRAEPEPEPTLRDLLRAQVDGSERQTAAITDLVDELRLWRTEDRAKLAQVEAAVKAMAGAALGERGTRGRATPDVLPGSTG